MELAPILILGGLVLTGWLWLWARQRAATDHPHRADDWLHDHPVAASFAANLASNGDAVLVARDHGQLVYMNETTRAWFGLDGAEPHLELIARRLDTPDAFLELFAGTTQTSFQLRDRWVEATALKIPAGDDETRTVVVMRELSGGAAAHADTLDLSRAITIINEIGETVNASLGVGPVLQALLTIVSKSIPADAGEICLWDQDAAALVPRGYVGDANYVVQLVTEANGQYQFGEGITGWVAQHRKPLLVIDRAAPDSVRPRLPDSHLYSFVAVPLQLGDRFIGTFELASTQPGRFTAADLALLQAIARPVATAIYNTELYAEQLHRIDDIASLQRITEQDDLTDAEQIFHTLSQRIASLLAADMCGILLYDERKGVLAAAPEFYGLHSELAKSIRISLTPGSAPYDIFHNRDYWISDDLVGEPLAEVMGLDMLINAAGIYNTLLLPLSIGKQRIGAVQLFNKASHGGFTQHDVNNLRILAAQAVVVVENIRLQQAEQRVNTELAGLQEVTQAIGGLSHDDEFFADMTQRIARLMHIEMCGLLLYDADAHRLRPQLPFYGVPDDLLADYDIALEPDSVLAQIWESRDTWIFNNVATDPVVLQSGLAEMTNATNTRSTIFAVMAAGGRRLGAVQAANKLNGEPFDDNDARLLLIFATQAAAVIENARLVRETQARASEAENVRRVAELASAISTADHAFTPVLGAIARQLDSPVVFVCQYDEDAGVLMTEPRHAYGIDLAEPLLQDVSRNRQQLVTLTRQPFTTEAMLTDAATPPSHRQSARDLSLRRVLIVPLIVGTTTMGELWIANRPDRPYTEAELPLVQALALPIAAALDRVRLNDSAGENLNRRMLELAAISRVSNELNETLELQQVLTVLHDAALSASQATGCSVAVFHPRANWRKPDQPEISYRIGEPIATLHLLPVEQTALQQPNQPIIVHDYTASPYEAMPKHAEAAVIAPILFADEPVGIIHLFADTPNHFDGQSATFVLALASKASLAYANAVRYEENVERSARLRRRVEQLNQIFELGQMLQGNHEPTVMLEAIAYSVQQSVGYDVVLMALVDEEAGVLRRATQAGLPLDDFEHSKSLSIPVETLQQVMRETYHISESYFLPLEHVGDWYVKGIEVLSTAFDSKRTLHPAAPDDWRDGDMLLVPMMGANGSLIGMMSLDRPFDNKRPERSQIEILEIFAHQAANTLENTRLYLASVNSAEQEARLNEVLEAITSTLDVSEIVTTVARGALRLLPFVRMTVALREVDRTDFEMLHVTVQLDNSLELASERRADLTGTALGHTVETETDYLYNVGDPAYDTYSDLRAWRDAGEDTSLIVPLLTGGQCLGALHIGSDLQYAYGFEEFRPLIKRLANLTAVAIQNANLFNEAVNLRLLNESVVDSIQQGIIVLDHTTRIVTINNYMRDYFGWTDDAKGQELFVYRPILDFLADDVQQVLTTGSPGERINQPIVVNNERQMRNFYLYPRFTTDQRRGVVVLVEDITERARLEQNNALRAQQMATLTEVSNRITASLQREAVINLALEEMENVIAYDTMTLWQRVGDVMQMESSRGLPVVPVQRPQVGIASHERVRRLVETHRPISVSRLQGWDPLPGEDQIHSWLGVPLIRRGEVIGMIALGKNEQRYYDEQAELAAATFANQVAVALVNADLYTEAERRTQRLSLLNRVSVALAQSLDNENILEIALQEIAKMLNVDRGRAFILEREVRLARGVIEYPRGDVPPGALKFDESEVLQYINRHARPLIVEKIDALAEDDPLRHDLEGRGLRAFAAIPIALAGQPIGLIELEVHGDAFDFAPEQIDLALIIANQAAIALQNANLLEQTLVRTRELETLLEAAQATSFTLDLDAVFQNVARLTLQALDMDDCVITLYNPVENVLEVQIDESRYGARVDRLAPGTRISLRDYPTRRFALTEKQVVTIQANSDDIDPSERAEMEQINSKARMFVPLISRDQSMGLIQIELQSEYRVFGHRDIRMAQALGAQAATAIENARLSTETAARVEELLVINDISRAISATMDIDVMIRIVHDQVPKLTDADEIYLALYNAKTDTITFPMAVRRGADYAIPPRQLGKDEVSYVIRYRRVLSLGGDFNLDEMLQNLGIIRDEVNVKAYLGVPLISGDEVLGVLAVVNTDATRTFGLNDQRILTTIGTQLAAAIQNARLFNQIRNFADELNQAVQERTLELQEERDRIEALYQITAELSRTLDIDRVLQSALDMVVAAVNAEEGVILLIDPQTTRLYNRASYLPATLPTGTTRRPRHVAEELGDWIINNVRGVVIDDLHDMEYWNRTLPDADMWRGALAVLLETNEDILGAMVMLSTQPAAFTEPQLRLATAAATQVAKAINNADLYKLIRDQAERLRVLLRTEQEEAEKSSAILESIADGVVVADAAGDIVLLNTAAERILETDRSAVLDKPVTELAARFDGSANQWIETVANWNTRSMMIGDDAWMRFERIDLGDRIVNIQSSPVNIGEQLIGTVSVIRDITRDVEVDRMKSEFIANVSHELRTPMTSIKGYTDLLVMGAAGKISDQQHFFLDTIKNNADRMTLLVDDLLNISKLDSGSEQLELKQIDLGQMIDSITQTLAGRVRYSEKNMQVSTRIDEDVPIVEADANRLVQVITNLVDNAFNYTYAGGTINIKVSRRAEKDHVLISVQDTGIGIPLAFQSRIWERFERYEDHALVMDAAGTGLGLPIAKHLVEMHRGEIWFESQENAGTTFFVSLPIRQTAPTHAVKGDGQPAIQE